MEFQEPTEGECREYERLIDDIIAHILLYPNTFNPVNFEQDIKIFLEELETLISIYKNRVEAELYYDDDWFDFDWEEEKDTDEFELEDWVK